MPKKTFIEPKNAQLTPEQIKNGIKKIQKRIEDLENFNPQTIQECSSPEVEAIEISIDEALSTTFGHNTIEYNRYRGASHLDNGPIFYNRTYVDYKHYLTEGKKSSIILLKQAISFLEERLSEYPELQMSSMQKSPTISNKVFLVHGHDDGARETVARFLEKLGLSPIILHEQPNKGRTIITKFNEEASDVGFAIVLMTPDDIGGKTQETLQQRARQNVVFELGFFIGKLGAAKVAAMMKGSIEKPSDFDGVVYISIDGSDWKTSLARELKAASYEIDWNKVMQ